MSNLEYQLTDYTIEDLKYHEGDVFLPYRDNPKVKKVGSHTIITAERGAEIAKCMEDPIYFCRNYLKLITLDHGLQPFFPRPYQIKTINTIIKDRNVICKWGRQSGKALDLETDIPTDTGWKKMKDIRVGDVLFNQYGQQTNVTFISEDHFKPTYRVTLSDNTTIDCCEDHLWEVYDHGHRRINKGKTVTVDTKSMFNSGTKLFNSTVENRYFIPVSEAIEYNTQDLPIDPYLLGVWLGDGTRGQGNITVHKDDANELIKTLRLDELGYTYDLRCYNSVFPNTLTLTVYGLYAQLRKLGVLKTKTIPDIYLQSSIEQRTHLLQGLLDTDGTCGDAGDISITCSDKYSTLKDNIRELIASLGVKYKEYNYQNHKHPSTTLRFMVSRSELNCFKLVRKLDKQQVAPFTCKNKKRAIVSIHPIETKTTRCLTVDSPCHTFLCTKNYIVTHNTATVAAVVVWLLLFNENGEYEAAILAHKQDQAIEIMDRVKIYYENLPLWFQKNVKTWNKKTLELAGNAKAFAAATSSGSVRGRTLNFVFCDEFALVDNAEEFFTGTFPTISSGQESKFIIASTPKGFNLFYKLWKDAEEGKSDFIPVSINWWDVPGRDENWKKGEIARTSEALFAQEYEANFLGSSNTLISGQKLGTITFIPAIMTDESKDILHIFETPVLGNKYLICADVSEGVGGDSSSFIVVDVTQLPYKIVATYDNDLLDPLMYPNVLHDVGTYFNTAYIAIESNTIGHGVVNTLYMDLEYENIISTNTKNKVTDDIMEGGRQILGIRQTKKTKHKGTSTLKTLIENDQFIINDFRVFYQLSRFVRKGSSFQAEPGEHDDLVMCLVLFAYITSLPTFKEITGTDLTLAMNQRSIYDQQILPFGVFVDSGQGVQDIMDFNSLDAFDQWMVD